jgi:aryl-alcohol dehydrogenase-like predicted oxidoreductase
MSTPASSDKPRIILGLMNFGPDPSRGARVTNLAEFKSALDLFQEWGYNELDTARSYVGGEQESFTRTAGWKERGMAIATKVYPRPAGTHRAKVIIEKFETSLKELGTNCVDVSFSVPFKPIDILESNKLDRLSTCCCQYNRTRTTPRKEGHKKVANID